MATLLKTWSTLWLRGGSSKSNPDMDGTIKVYLVSQSTSGNYSDIRIDHQFTTYFSGSTSTADSATDIKSSYRANQGSYGGTYKSVTAYSGSQLLFYGGGLQGPFNMGSTTHRINHQADGKATLYVNGSISAKIWANGSSGTYSKSSSFSVALPTIPRATTINSFTWAKASGAAGLSRLTCSWSTANSIDRIQYSLNGGAYTTVSGSGTSGSFNISGLNPNTEYSMRIKVRRADSQVETESGTLYATTYDIAKITSAINFNDSQKPKINFSNPSGSRVDAFIGYYDGTGIWKNSIANTGSYEFNLTQAEWNILYERNYNLANFTIKYEIKTNNNNNWTNHVIRNMTIINANPTFTTWTYADTNATTLALTGNSQSIIKGYSNVRASVTTANKMVANKGASAVRYLLTIGSGTKSVAYSSGSTVTMDINAVTTNEMNVGATDSRGNTTTVSKTATTYFNYTPINITRATAVRTDGIGEVVTLAFKGTYSNLDFGDVTNSIKTATYKYKKTTESTYSDAVDITPTPSGGTFSFSGGIIGDKALSGFDALYSYNIQITVTDELSTKTFNTILGSGTPQLAISQNGVAINGAYDETLGGALQVNGAMTYQPESLNNLDCNNLIGRVITGYGNFMTNRPSGSGNGYFENIPHDNLPLTYNMQRFTERPNNTVWTRNMDNGVWGDWVRLASGNEILDVNVMTLGLTSNAFLTISSPWTRSNLPFNKTIRRIGTKLTFSNGGIQIGAGVHHVRVGGNAMVSGISTGNMIIGIRQNTTLISEGYHTTTDSYFWGTIGLSSQVIPVNEGDVIYMCYAAGVTGDLKIASAAFTFLTVEVIN